MMPNAPRGHRDQEQCEHYRKNQISDLFWLLHRRLKTGLSHDHIADVLWLQSVASRCCRGVQGDVRLPSTILSRAGPRKLCPFLWENSMVSIGMFQRFLHERDAFLDALAQRPINFLLPRPRRK